MEWRAWSWHQDKGTWGGTPEGKPVLEFHHGRSTQWRTSLTTQQPDEAVGSVVSDIGIRIGPVIDVVLPVEAGGKTFAGQQPDKVVGTTPIGARHPIVEIYNTRAPDHDYDEVEVLPGRLETSANSRNPRKASDQHLHQGAMTGSLGARHPISTPTTRVTNHSTWPVNMIGLVGWWRRVEREGEREELARRKQTRLLEGREGELTWKQSFTKKLM
jgi:hypothetical protein